MHHATLIAVTQPEQDLSVEEFIVYCARVSNPANQAEHRTIAEYAWSNIVGLCPSLEGLNDSK